MIDIEQFRNGMRRLASGVTIVATGKGPARRGLTASAVCSLSASPPSLIACVNEAAGAHDAILLNRVFCVSVLGREHQELAMRFSEPGAGERRFDLGEWDTLETGAPALKTAIANFDCRLHEFIPHNTHTIFIGEIVAIRMDTASPALLYSDGRYCGLAPEAPTKTA